MIDYLGNFHQAPIRAEAAEAHPGFLEALAIRIVELEAVAMTLLDALVSVDVLGFAVIFQFTGLRPSRMVPPISRRLCWSGISAMTESVRHFEFAAVGVFEIEDVAGELNRHHLHPQAQADVGHFLLAGETYCGIISLPSMPR